MRYGLLVVWLGLGCADVSPFEGPGRMLAFHSESISGLAIGDEDLYYGTKEAGIAPPGGGGATTVPGGPVGDLDLYRVPKAGGSFELALGRALKDGSDGSGPTPTVTANGRHAYANLGTVVYQASADNAGLDIAEVEAFEFVGTDDVICAVLPEADCVWIAAKKALTNPARVAVQLSAKPAVPGAACRAPVDLWGTDATRCAIAADESHVYVTMVRASQQRLVRVPRAVGTAEVLHGDLSGFSAEPNAERVSLAVGGGWLILGRASGAEGELMSVGLDGIRNPAALQTLQSGPIGAIAFHDDWLYVVEQDPSEDRQTIYRMRGDGSKRDAVVSAFHDIVEFVVQDGVVYWVEDDPNGLYRFDL